MGQRAAFESSPQIVPPTSSATTTVALERRTSYVRLKSPFTSDDAGGAAEPVSVSEPEPEPEAPAIDADRADVERFVGMLIDDDRRLSALLSVLGGSVAAHPYDPSARAAAAAVSQRVGDVGFVRDALREVLAAAGGHVELAPLVAPDAPLGPFLKGVTIWCDGVLEALAIIEGQLRALSPDWDAMRRRFAEAGQFFFWGLIDQIREHIALLDGAGFGGPSLDAMREAVEDLFFAARVLEKNLTQRFG